MANRKWLAVVALALTCAPAFADPLTRLPCTTDNTDNCYTPYVHSDGSFGGGTGGAGNSVPLASGTSGITGAAVGTSSSQIVPAAASGSPRRFLSIVNQSNQGAIVTVCPSYGPTPASAGYQAGCYTLGPGGTYTASASGYVPQEAFNAAASAANTPITIEVH